MGEIEQPRSHVEVRAPSGRLRGAIVDGVAVFLGIPFAEPPVRELRFAAPQPVRDWKGVRDALSYGPPPPQAGHFGMDALTQDSTGEDWLTLNVWTPCADPSAGLPVMVWVQGGGYEVGMSSLPEYDGRTLAQEGDVVVVTFNYRVGVEGFALIEGAVPNRGLLDQVAALAWVGENVHAFGGDPDRITVFGQSAGGGSIAALLAMDRADGLFHQAIVQSMPGTYFSRELAADVTAACAGRLGLQPTAAALAEVPAAELAKAADQVSGQLGQADHRWGQAACRRILFSPVVDSDVLPGTPWQALAKGSGRGVALLVGHTCDEQRLFTVIEGRLGRISRSQASEALQVLAPGTDGARRYREAFPAAAPEELYELVNSDWLFRVPSLHLAEAQADAGGSAYVYELTWPAPGMDGIFGACHGLDVPLVFGNLDRGQPALLIGPTGTAEAQIVSAQMRTAWTSFAADGNPGWPAYDTEHRLVQRFDLSTEVISYPEEKSRQIWRDHTFSALPLRG